jgi:hypothetical protein
MRSGKGEGGRGGLVRRREVGKMGLMGRGWRMVQRSQVVRGGENGTLPPRPPGPRAAPAPCQRAH